MLDAKTKERLAAILGMMGSEHLGERAAAALRADTLRREHNLSWRQLLGIEPDNRNSARSSRHLRSTGACYFIGAPNRWNRSGYETDRTIDRVIDFIEASGWWENRDYMLLMPAKEIALLGGSYVRQHTGGNLMVTHAKFLVIFDPRHASLFAASFPDIGQIGSEDVQKAAGNNEWIWPFQTIY